MNIVMYELFDIGFDSLLHSWNCFYFFRNVFNRLSSLIYNAPYWIYVLASTEFRHFIQCSELYYMPTDIRRSTFGLCL